MSKRKPPIQEDTCLCQKCAQVVPGSQADWQLVVGTSQMGNVCKTCQKKWADAVVDNKVKVKPANGEAPGAPKTTAPGTLINNKFRQQYSFIPQESGMVGVIFISQSGMSRNELTAAEARYLWVTLKSMGFEKF